MFMENKIITEESLISLREGIKPYLDEKRYHHTLAVEREAIRLGEIYLPEKVTSLRAAALLHDITKKCDFEKQLQYCREFGIIMNEYDIRSPKTFHARTAAALISADFPCFATDEIISGVRWHTTGHDKMTTFEAIVYLADYIEDTRTFADCITLRRFFWDGISAGRDKDKLLSETMIMSFDMTMKNLIEEKAPIDTDTVQARSYYLALAASQEDILVTR